MERTLNQLLEMLLHIHRQTAQEALHVVKIRQYNRLEMYQTRKLQL